MLSYNALFTILILFHFSSPKNPALSCSDLFTKVPDLPSGSYWIQSADRKEKMLVSEEWMMISVSFLSYYNILLLCSVTSPKGHSKIVYSRKLHSPFHWPRSNILF